MTLVTLSIVFGFIAGGVGYLSFQSMVSNDLQLYIHSHGAAVDEEAVSRGQPIDSAAASLQMSGSRRSWNPFYRSGSRFSGSVLTD